MGGTTTNASNDLQLEENYKKYLSPMSLIDQIDVKMWQYIGRNRHTPKSFFDSWFVPKTLALKHTVRTKFGALHEQEFNAWVEFMNLQYSLPDSTDVSLHTLINFPQAQAHQSIES